MLGRKCWIVSGSIQKMYLWCWEGLKAGISLSSPGHSVLAGQSPHHRWRYSVWAVTENWTPAPCLTIDLAPSPWNLHGKQSGQNCACHASRSAERPGARRQSQSPLCPRDDGAKPEFCLQPGKPRWLGSRTDASDLGGKLKRVVFGKAEGVLAWGSISWEVLGAILMQQVRRGISNCAPSSVKNSGIKVHGKGLWCFAGTSLAWGTSQFPPRI